MESYFYHDDAQNLKIFIVEVIVVIATTCGLAVGMYFTPSMSVTGFLIFTTFYWMAVGGYALALWYVYSLWYLCYLKI
jgi:hypothetical protein